MRSIASAGGAAATTWVSGLACYQPFAIPWPYPVKRVFWFNGSTITSTNAELAIYNCDGVELYTTGATAMVGASARQFVTPTVPFVLAPGAYYWGWTCDNTTNRAWAQTITSAATGRMIGLLQQSSASPLPATMTPVAWAQTFGGVYVGMTRYSAGF